MSLPRFGRFHALLLIMLSASAVAQVVAESAKPTAPLPETTVIGTRDRQKQLTIYVRQVTKSRWQEKSLARWRDPICLTILGLPQEQTDFIANRVATIAKSIGAKMDDKKCAFNLIALITPEPDPVLELWNSTTRPFSDAWPSVVQEFLHSKLPVRTWYSVQPRDLMGQSVQRAPADQSPSFHTSRGSRLLLDSGRAFTLVIVVIDTSRAVGFKLGAMADYVAMVGLAQVNNEDANTGVVPSILTLFSAGADARPDGLTIADTAFLKSLYDLSEDFGLQRAIVVRSMMREFENQPKIQSPSSPSN